MYISIYILYLYLICYVGNDGFAEALRALLAPAVDVHRSTPRSIYVYTYLSIYINIDLSIYLSIYIYIPIYTYLYLSIYYVVHDRFAEAFR